MPEKKYVMNIMMYNKVCECDLCNSIFEEVEKKEDTTLSKGIYSEILDSRFRVVGLVGSYEGPVLFLDREQYVISSSDFSFFQQSIEDNKGKFTAYINGEKLIDLVYRKPFTDYDAWSREEDIDFFQWILKFSENSETKEKFLRIYTT